MTVADASRIVAKYAKETGGYGVTPAGTWQKIRLVNETLSQNKEVVQSDEALDDRMPPDNIQVGLGASGEIVGELSHAAYDDFFEWGLLSTAWSTKVENVYSASYAAGAGSLSTLTAAGEDFGADGYTVGSWVRLSGAATAAHEGYWKINAVGTTTLTLETGPQFGTEGAVSTTVEQLSQIQNGVTLSTFSFAREYANLTNEFAVLAGNAIQGFDLRARGKDKVGITFVVLGKQEKSETTDPAAGTTAATTNKVFSVVTDVALFAINGDATSKLTNFEIAYRNGLYVLDEEAGTLGPIGVGQGTIENTGRHEFYYKQGADFANFELGVFTDLNYSIALEDAAGNGYVIEILRANQTSATRNHPGKDQPVKAQTEYRAAKEATESLMMKIARTS